MRTAEPWRVRYWKHTGEPNILEGAVQEAADGSWAGQWIATFPKLMPDAQIYQRSNAALLGAAPELLRTSRKALLLLELVGRGKGKLSPTELLFVVAAGELRAAIAEAETVVPWERQA